MVTCARKEWRLNKRGYYERQIGWKISASTGGHHQHKFTLGKNLQEAQWREQRIRELWERFGAYFVKDLAKDESVTFKVRFFVSPGVFPDRAEAVMKKRYDDFVAEVK